ncbi:MAG: hypothetical protein OJJ54_20875 [Pseudonocardia sp.]|nr:hypothetical protein [Pseudonocardia sp.]
MAPDPRDFGFWRAVGRLRLTQVFGRVEFYAAVILGVESSVFASKLATVDQKISAAGDFQALSGALAGVVFAGFSLVVTLLSDRYAVWLKSAPGGLPAFLGPFMVGIGIQLLSLLLAVGYRLSAKAIPSPWEAVFFTVSVTVFVYAALDVLSLARAVYAHAVTRTEIAELGNLEEQAKVLRVRRHES